MDRSCSSSLNGSNPEQIVHDKVGRISLEAIDTWNTIFDGVMWLFSYDERSPRKYLHKHIKHTRDQRYENIIYRSMSVTKESDNNMQDYNTTSIWERNQIYINKMKKELTTYALVLICSFTKLTSCPQQLQLAPSSSLDWLRPEYESNRITLPSLQPWGLSLLLLDLNG